MDILLVSIIVAAAMFFTTKSFVKIYKGEKGCSCGGCKEDCSGNLPGNLKDNCTQGFKD